jgi:hypothetical protein
MNTVQEVLTSVPPPPLVENPAELHRADLPTDQANVSSNLLESQISNLPSPNVSPAFAADAYHLPPSRYAPKASPYRYDDSTSAEIDATPLPERCQFMFSDGRQCTMARSDIHPSLCRFHAEREDQLFGDPSPAGCVVGRALDLPELYSACRDLTTAAGVNRALTLVFRLLAQRRISRQEAATFGHLAQLLLRTISLMRAESADPIRSPGESLSAANVYQSSRESLSAANVYPQDELRGADKVQELSRITKSTPLLPHDKVSPPQRKFGSSVRQPAPINGTSTPPLAPPPCFKPLPAPAPVKTLSGINTCADVVCNSSEISTYGNSQVKTVQNEHLQKNGRGAAPTPGRDRAT